MSIYKITNKQISLNHIKLCMTILNGLVPKGARVSVIKMFINGRQLIPKGLMVLQLDQLVIWIWLKIRNWSKCCIPDKPIDKMYNCFDCCISWWTNSFVMFYKDYKTNNASNYISKFGDSPWFGEQSVPECLQLSCAPMLFSMISININMSNDLIFTKYTIIIYHTAVMIEVVFRSARPDGVATWPSHHRLLPWMPMKEASQATGSQCRTLGANLILGIWA